MAVTGIQRKVGSLTRTRLDNQGMTLQPDSLARDATGTPYSERYGDVYASRDGALGQARHVFLGGNGLPERWRGREQFVVLETGFGLGTNFLATWHTGATMQNAPRRLHFVSVEQHPLLRRICGGGPAELRAGAQCLRQVGRCRCAGCIARIRRWPRVALTLALGDARDCCRNCGRCRCDLSRRLRTRSATPRCGSRSCSKTSRAARARTRRSRPTRVPARSGRRWQRRASKSSCAAATAASGICSLLVLRRATSCEGMSRPHPTTERGKAW